MEEEHSYEALEELEEAEKEAHGFEAAVDDLQEVVMGRQ